MIYQKNQREATLLHFQITISVKTKNHGIVKSIQQKP